jgi:prepilin-type N-terminal cleavage/methylation domain-containing protein
MNTLHTRPLQLKIQSQSGFTLIELITTIGIMALILSLTIANIHGSDASRNVSLAQSNLISDLHKIQAYAVNSEDYSANVTPSSAWGIATTSSTAYTIQSFDNTINQNVQLVSTVQLPTNVQFSSIQIQRPNGGGTVCPTSFAVQFTVPYGRVLTSYSGPSCSNNSNIVSGTLEPNDIITVVISSTTGSASQNVVINGISGNVVTP